MCPGLPGQIPEFEVVRAVVSLPCIGFDVGYGRDFQLGFVELTVFVHLDELGELFFAVLVFNLDIKVVELDHLIPFCFGVDVCGDVKAFGLGWCQHHLTLNVIAV